MLFPREPQSGSPVCWVQSKGKFEVSDPVAKNPILRICGALGLSAALLPIMADMLSWLLAKEYNPITQTISALAVGPSSWLIDIGLLLFALSCAAVSTGMLALRLPQAAWRVAEITIIGSGLTVAVITFVNQYAGQQNAGANIHMVMVFALYGLFAVAALAAAAGLRDLNDGAATFSRLAGFAWIVLAPVYYIWFPAGWAGAFERVLVLLMIAWLAMVARELRQEGRRPVKTV